MAGFSERLQVVRSRISAAAGQFGRNSGDIALVAVSKTFPASSIRAAYAAGQRDFGENYVQEAIEKIEALSDLPLTWHFIGPIQSNKTRDIAAHFDWVHSVDRLKVAERLSQQRAPKLTPMNVCLQVNVSEEVSKSGLAPAEVLSLAQAVVALPRLKLRGLMAIPEPTDDVGLQRDRFRTIRELAEQLRQAGMSIDTLSMGMSDDLESAIAEGATMIRVGRALFGERSRTVPPAL